MEVIELAGYTEEEKLRIARDHLVARQIANHGLDAGAGRRSPTRRCAAIIRGYTREAGVRNLEREIGAICRKIARRRAEGQTGAGDRHAARSSRSCSARRATSTRR